MPHKINAVTDFVRYAQDDLAAPVGVIGNSLTTHAADFAGLPFTGAQILTLLGNFTTILGKAEYDTRTEDLAASQKILIDALRVTGLKVNTIANGDLVLLAKSGFPTTSPHLPHGPVKAGVLEILPTSGSSIINYEVSGVVGQRGFLLCYTDSKNPETDQTKWSWKWCPTSSGILKGLVGSTKYKFAMVGLGTDDAVMNFSNTVECTTQG